MRYCVRCLYPENHPFGIVFDEQGVCSGCRVHEEKDTFDWNARFEQLKKQVARLKSSSPTNYDCIIPVSGGRDSYFIVKTVKEKLGLHPLLVTYNRHYNTKLGLRNYAYLKTIFNCDALQMVLSPEKVKRVTRTTLEKMGSMHWHAIAGQTVFPVQVAVRFKIPLIIWGHHQGLDQVGMFSHSDEVEMTRKYRHEHDLMGWEAERLLEETPGAQANDFLPYFYPHNREIERVGVRGIYLGNYIRWDTKAQHERMIEEHGYETRALQRTFDFYNDVECQHYTGVHDWIKFLKLGYSKVTDHASREIRLKRMTREQGIDRVRMHTETLPSDLPEFLQWLGITATEFYSLVNRHRDPRAWQKPLNGDWQLRDSVTHHAKDPGVESARLRTSESCEFRVTPPKEAFVPEREMALLHKGFVHHWQDSGA